MCWQFNSFLTCKFLVYMEYRLIIVVERNLGKDAIGVEAKTCSVQHDVEPYK